MKSALKYSVSNFIKLLENVILNIGLARVILDISDFGRLQQFLIISTFLVTLLSAFPTSMNFFVGRYSENRDREALYKRFFIAVCGFSIAIVVLFTSMQESLVSWFNNDFFKTYYLYFVLILLIKLINSYYSNFYLFSNKLTYFNIISFIFLILYGIGFLVFNFQYHASITELLLFLLIYEVTKALFLFIPFYLSVSVIRLRSNILLKPEELMYVVPMLILVTAGILNMQIDKYMISIMMTPTDFAFYQVGAFNIPFVGVITASFFTIITPEISKALIKNDLSKIISITKTTTKQTTLFLLPVIIFSFFFSKEIITLLFGIKYESSGGIFKFYTIRFLMSVFPFSIYMGMIGLKNYASFHVILGAFLNIGFNIILIPRFGVMGAIYATLLASYLTVTIPVLFIKNRLNTKLRSLFPFKYYLKTMVISITIAWAFYQLSNSLEEIIDSRILVIPLSIVYYIVILMIIDSNAITTLWKNIK